MTGLKKAGSGHVALHSGMFGSLHLDLSSDCQTM